LESTWLVERFASFSMVCCIAFEKESLTAPMVDGLYHSPASQPAQLSGDSFGPMRRFAVLVGSHRLDSRIAFSPVHFACSLCLRCDVSANLYFLFFLDHSNTTSRLSSNHHSFLPTRTIINTHIPHCY
jgi:hypothetical protein